MKTLTIITALFFAIHGDAFAQSGIKFRSQNYAGALNGESGAAFQIQSVNGLQYHSWFFGAGTGLDYYRLRSIPLFLSVSRFLTPAQRSFFVSVDGGVNFIWKETNKTEQHYANSRFPPSLYAAGGLGYKIGLKNSDALLLYAGYSVKRLTEKAETPVECFCPAMNERYNYTFNRLSLKLGWQF